MPYNWKYLTLMAATLISGVAGCAILPEQPGWQEPRPLGREYRTYKPPLPSAKKRAAPEAPLPEEGKGPISLSQALALALLRNPNLAAFSWDIRAAEARRLQAGLLPNPELSTEVEEVSGNRRGFNESETTVMLSQLVWLGGKRAKRIRLTGLERDLAGWDYEAARLDVFTQVVQAFVSVLGAQRQLTIAQETVGIAEDVASAASQRVEAGAASSVEETRAKVALSSARIEFERARQSLAAARKRLAATWGMKDAVFTEARGDLEIALILPPLSKLSKHLSQNPDLARWAVEIDRRRARLELEKARAIPDITLEAGYRHYAEDDTDTFVAAFSLPLPMFNRNQGGIMEGRANLSKAEEEKRAAEVRIATELAETYATLAAAVNEVLLLKTQVVPGAQAAFDTIDEGYREGKFTYLDLLTTQKTLAETQSQYVRALVSLHQAKAEVERLIGEPLPLGEDNP